MTYTDLTLIEQKELLNEGKATSLEILEQYIERIKKYDKEINSFLYLDEEGAREEAKKLDEERKCGKIRGKLHGLVIGIKDNMNVLDMPMTCASKFLEGFVSPYDATVVKRIKEEGGIIIGKLNMDEFAMGSTNEYSAYGAVSNPYDYDRVPGGSSGGSAACVAADFAPVSLGSDTGGSVRQPSAFCNLVGLKPTYGRISRYGVTAFASTLDQVGIFSKKVDDCALMLDVIGGYDNMDSTSSKKEKYEYKSELASDVSGMKIAIAKNFLSGLDEKIKASVLKQVETLKNSGAQVEEIELKMAPKSLAVYYIVACAEASSNLSRFDGIRYGKRSENFKDMTDLYKESRSQGFGDEVKRRIMLGTYVLSAGYYDAYYKTALKVRTLIKKEFEEVFSKYDAIIGPSAPFLPGKLGEKHENVVEVYLNDLYTVPANIAGIPAISVPCSFIDGLPVGLQIMGNYFEEEKLFKIAKVIENKEESYKNKPQLREGK